MGDGGWWVMVVAMVVGAGVVCVDGWVGRGAGWVGRMCRIFIYDIVAAIAVSVLIQQIGPEIGWVGVGWRRIGWDGIGSGGMG